MISPFFVTFQNFAFRHDFKAQYHYPVQVQRLKNPILVRLIFCNLRQSSKTSITRISYESEAQQEQEKRTRPIVENIA